MNRIHTAILALVMGIFLIQAIDPPFEKTTGTFLQFYPLRNIPTVRAPNLLTKDAQDRSRQEILASDRRDNFPYSLTTELKPPPTVETELIPPPLPSGALVNIITDNIKQSSEIIQKHKKPLPAIRYLDILELDALSSLPIENSVNNNADSLYPPLNIDLSKLTPEQIETLNKKIPDGPNSSLQLDSLSRLREYLTNIRSNYKQESAASENSYTVVNFNGSANDVVLGKDFIKPLLKLYENEIHHDATNNGNSSPLGNLSDLDEEIKTFTQNELHLLIHGAEQNGATNVDNINSYNEALIVGNGENNRYPDQQYYANNIQGSNVANNEINNRENNVRIDEARKELDAKINKNRRDDTYLTTANDNEHIGEILPLNFKKENLLNNQMQVHPVQVSYSRKNYRMRKSFEPTSQSGNRRIPFSFPGDRFRPEYEPSGLSSDGADFAEYQRLHLTGNEQLHPRAPRLSLPPTEVSGFRLPRRYRGFREAHSEGFQPYFDNSARYQNVWSVRKPRVIFPTDLVAFRDTDPNANKDLETDWLAGDNQLQDLQEQDTVDRGKCK